MEILPRFVTKEGVVAIGEIGYTSRQSSRTNF